MGLAVLWNCRIFTSWSSLALRLLMPSVSTTKMVRSSEAWSGVLRMCNPFVHADVVSPTVKVPSSVWHSVLSRKDLPVR